VAPTSTRPKKNAFKQMVSSSTLRNPSKKQKQQQVDRLPMPPQLLPIKKQKQHQVDRPPMPPQLLPQKATARDAAFAPPEPVYMTLGLDDVDAVLRRLSFHTSLALGLDVEARPTFKRGETCNRVDTIQLCSESACVVVSLGGARALPPLLGRLVSSTSVLKFGCGVVDDLQLLAKRFPVTFSAGISSPGGGGGGGGCGGGSSSHGSKIGSSHGAKVCVEGCVELAVLAPLTGAAAG
jgi:hypothetical protein